MMKRLASILCAMTVLLCGLLFSSHGEEQFIHDYAKVISAETEARLEAMAQQIYVDSFVAPHFFVLDDESVENTFEYGKSYLKSLENKNCILFVFNIPTNRYAVLAGYDYLFTDEELEAIGEAYNDDAATTYALGAEYYLDAVQLALTDSAQPGDDYTPLPECGEAFPLPIPNVRGAEGIPEARLQPRLVDAAGIIPDDQETEILALLDRLSEADQMEYAIATTASCGSKTPEATADDYYDYNGFGFGEERSGVLLLISMDPRYVHVSTCGKGMQVIRNSEVDSFLDKFYAPLKSGDYAQACLDFAEAAHNEWRVTKFYPVIALVIALGLGALVGRIVISSMKKGYVSVRPEPSAANYMVPGTFVLTENRDVFRSSYVTKTPIPKDTGSGGSSGGGSHVSSSGSSHGGGGRSF